MKYEYQDSIVNEIIKQKGNDIDKNTLNTATIDIFHYQFGKFKAYPEYCAQDGNSEIYMHIVNGCVCGIYDKQGSEYSIDFTVYEIDYPLGRENHILCYLDVT